MMYVCTVWVNNVKYFINHLCGHRDRMILNIEYGILSFVAILFSGPFTRARARAGAFEIALRRVSRF